MQKVYLSPSKIKELKASYEKLAKELREFHEEESATILMSLREAASNNADISAKESEVRRLKSILAKAKELPERIDSEKAILGSYIKLEDENNKVIQYRLVHPLEADPGQHLLSVESPLGKILKNKKAGDQLEFNGKQFTIKGIC